MTFDRIGECDFEAAGAVTEADGQLWHLVSGSSERQFRLNGDFDCFAEIRIQDLSCRR